MALQRKYDELFEKYIWGPYPKWPAGRSRKELAYKAYLAVRKILGLTLQDHEAIMGDIEKRKRDCVTWQKGSKYGPVGCQVYINQMLWNEPYEKVKGASHREDAPSQDMWRNMGYADFEAYCRGERLNGTPH